MSGYLGVMRTPASPAGIDWTWRPITQRMDATPGDLGLARAGWRSGFEARRDHVPCSSTKGNELSWLSRLVREPSGQLSSQQTRDAGHWRNIDRNTREVNDRLGLTAGRERITPPGRHRA
jgi:hypothetical protein